MAVSVQSLPAEDRVAYYRAMAAESFRQSQICTTEKQKFGSLAAAARWHALAGEVEAQMERAADMPVSMAVATPQEPVAR